MFKLIKLNESLCYLIETENAQFQKHNFNMHITFSWMSLFCMAKKTSGKY